MEERFWAKVDKTGECWVWTAYRDPEGYGRFHLSGDSAYAHRVVYELVVGPIPDGRMIDHLCRNRACVNPSHLEPVTSRENTLRSPIAGAALNARKTHCKRGHEFTDENTWLNRDGGRHCRTCHREKAREQSLAKRTKLR